MIHLTLQERKVLLFLVFLFLTGLVVRIYSKARPQDHFFSEPRLSQEADAILDINLAQEEQLMTLPGIGEKTAQVIIAYRQEYGPFKNVDELMHVKGIGVKKLEKFKGRLVVNR